MALEFAYCSQNQSKLQKINSRPVRISFFASSSNENRFAFTLRAEAFHIPTFLRGDMKGLCSQGKTVLSFGLIGRFNKILSRFCACSGSQKFHLCSGPEQSQFLRFYAAKCRSEFHLKNIFLFYTPAIRNCFVWIIFYSGVGF